jgi:type IV pilus assembly protein PilM
MAIPKIIGLDIGSNAVKMVEIDRSKKGFELEYVGVAPLPDGAIVDKSIKKADLVGTPSGLCITYRAETIRGYLACRQGGDYQQVTMTSMTDGQLEKQIQMEAEPYIPFDIKDVNLDFFIMGDRPEKEGSMEVVLVAAKKEYMAEYLDLIKSLNLNPVIVDVDPFALEVMYEFCYPNVQEEIVALVNVGASTININILKSGASQFPEIFRLEIR